MRSDGREGMGKIRDGCISRHHRNRVDDFPLEYNDNLEN